MRIALINTEKTWRGGERQTLYTLIGLKELGIKVLLISLENSPLSKKAKKADIDVFEGKSYIDTLKKIILLKPEYDILHAQSGKAHTQAIISKIYHQKPVVYTRRVDFFPGAFLTRLKYKYTDQVIAISEKISEILTSNNIYSNVPIISSAVMDKSLNTKRAYELKRSLGIKESFPIVGLISALEDHKDPFLAIEIAKLTHKENPNIHFIHFGSGKLLEEFQERIYQDSMDKYYHSMGHFEEVEDFFAIMDIFLMTSKMEGLGSSVLDAFNYQVPVVSTDAGGLKNLVKNKGLICKSGDASCLAKSINKILLSKELHKNIVINAKNYSDKNHSIHNMIQSYMRVYQSLI